MFLHDRSKAGRIHNLSQPGAQQWIGRLREPFLVDFGKLANEWEDACIGDGLRVAEQIARCTQAFFQLL
jgi:hypothetical protein